jgi:hypothetical protein
MSITAIYNDHNSLILTYSGVVSGNKIVEMVSSIFNDDRFASLKYWISDLTQCELQIDTLQVKKLVELTKIAVPKNQKIIIVIVAPDQLAYGFSRMYEILCCNAGFKTFVCKSLDEAEKWLSDQTLAD